MTEEEWRQQLIKDGFKEVWVHEDKPDCEYEEHEHPVDTAHVVLKGSMVVVINGRPREVKENQRLDIKKHIAHTAKTGPQGCTFLMGAKI